MSASYGFARIISRTGVCEPVSKQFHKKFSKPSGFFEWVKLEHYQQSDIFTYGLLSVHGIVQGPVLCVHMAPLDPHDLSVFVAFALKGNFLSNQSRNRYIRGDLVWQ